jgi:hypothetical protein
MKDIMQQDGMHLDLRRLPEREIFYDVPWQAYIHPRNHCAYIRRFAFLSGGMLPKEPRGTLQMAIVRVMSDLYVEYPKLEYPAPYIFEEQALPVTVVDFDTLLDLCDGGEYNSPGPRFGLSITACAIFVRVLRLMWRMAFNRGVK